MHLAWLLVILLAPSLAAAAARTYSDLAFLVIDVINAAIGVTFVLAIVIYFFGIARKIPSVNKSGAWKDLGTQMLWGLIALFVMFSIWGILRLVQNTLFSGSVTNFGEARSGFECDSIDECGFGE